MSRVIVVNTLGPQGPPGPQGPAGSGSIDTGSFATTGSNSFIGNQTISGSLLVTGSVLISGSNTFTNIGPTILSGSVNISGSTTINGNNVLTTANTGSLNVLSSSYASTASYVNTLNQDLTFNGNLTLNGTASITYLNTIYETASVIYSSGSNQFGDAAVDVQTLYGSVVIPTGSLTVTGSTIISSSAATQLQVGSNLLFVSSSGNVGIGTNAPTQKLHVSSGNAFVNGIIYFGDGSHYLTTDNSTYTMLSSNRNLQLARSGFAALTVFSTLNIGIGTTTDSGAKLYISGSSNSALLRVDSDASSSILFISGSGRVGIGTSTPDRPLHISSSGTTGLRIDTTGVGGDAIFISNASALIRWAGGSYVNKQGFYSGTDDQQYITFDGASTQVRLQIKASNGNVGIGTTTDSGFKLDVSGSGRFTNGLTVTGSVTASGNIVASSYLGDPNVQFGLNPSSGANTYIRLENTGLVPNGILFNTNNTSNSFKFKHDTNYTFTLGYQNTSAAWFGSNTSLVTVNASAQVQIDSTTKGFLPPRTNLTSNISTPAQGLMTYLTGSTNEGLYYYNSGSYQAWTKLLNNSGSQNITGSLSVSGSITQNGVSLQALSIAYAIALG